MLFPFLPNCKVITRRLMMCQHVCTGTVPSYLYSREHLRRHIAVNIYDVIWPISREVTLVIRRHFKPFLAVSDRGSEGASWSISWHFCLRASQFPNVRATNRGIISPIDNIIIYHCFRAQGHWGKPYLILKSFISQASSSNCLLKARGS